MTAPRPYWSDAGVTIWHGDCRTLVLDAQVKADSCVTDPPYGEIVADWDVWPEGWLDSVGLALPASSSLWCFGSFRMFLDRAAEFKSADWRFGQDRHVLWEKHNGTAPGATGRLIKNHELALHWYRGRWSDLRHSWDREPAQHGDKGHVRGISSQAPHHGAGRRKGAWDDDGFCRPRTVAHIKAPSVRYKRHPYTEKPLSVVLPIVAECTPPGGVVLDPMAGSGTVGQAAQILGLTAVLMDSDEAACEYMAKRLSCPPLFTMEGI